MGKKLGAAFIIYGILNLIGSVVFLFMLPIVGLAGIVWSIIFIGIGAWMRRRAEAQEFRDINTAKQTAALERMADKLSEKEKAELK